MRLKTLSNEIDAVIFDLDGTLTDSMWMWTDIDIAYLSRFGYEFDKQLQTDIAGMSITETAVYFKKNYQIPYSLEEIIQDWIRMSIDKYQHEVPLKPYTRELLSALRENGVRTAIASSNAIEMIEACLYSNSIQDQFDKVVTSNQVKRGKPYPDVYLYAAECIGAEPSRCLVFEDIPAGLQAAKAAGMTAIAVYDDFSADVEDEKHSIADFYYHDFGAFLRAEGLL